MDQVPGTRITKAFGIVPAGGPDEMKCSVRALRETGVAKLFGLADIRLQESSRHVGPVITVFAPKKAKVFLVGVAEGSEQVNIFFADVQRSVAGARDSEHQQRSCY